MAASKQGERNQQQYEPLVKSCAVEAKSQSCRPMFDIDDDDENDDDEDEDSWPDRTWHCIDPSQGSKSSFSVQYGNQHS